MQQVTLTPRLRTLLAVGFILIVAFLFSWPMLIRLTAIGIWDWTEAAGHYESLRQTVFRYGQFPLWNPYQCGGVPSLGNPQTYWLSLTGLFALMFGSIVGPKLAVPLYLVIGGIGTYLLARAFKIRFPAALLTIPVYLTSGFLATHLSVGQFLWLNLAWVPWVLWGYVTSDRHPWRIVVGGVALTLIGLEGRSYLVAYAIIMVGAHALMADVLLGRIRWLWRAGTVAALGFLLGAWKFLPDIALLSREGTSLPDTLGTPLALVPKIFLLRDVMPLATHAEGLVGTGVPWLEYGYYVGVVPLLLAGLGLAIHIRRRMLIPWLFVGVVLSVIILSDPQHSITEAIPVLSELRNPQRAISMVVLIMGLLAAMGLDALQRALKWGGQLVAVLLISVVVADLLVVTGPALAEGYANVTIPEPDEERPPSTAMFYQSAGYSTPYQSAVLNRGAASFCPAIMKPWFADSPVLDSEVEGYRGPVYLDGAGTIESAAVTPNVITVRVQAEQPTQLVVNQNYDPGWHSFPGDVNNYGRLLGVQIPAGTYTVRLTYRPPGMRVGLALTAITIIALGTLWWRRRRAVTAA